MWLSVVGVASVWYSVFVTDQEAIKVAKTIKAYFDPKALPEFHEALNRLIANTERKLYGISSAP